MLYFQLSQEKSLNVYPSKQEILQIFKATK